MGVPWVQRLNVTGAAVPCVLDYTQTPFDMSAAVVLEGASTATFSVEYTLDDVNDASITPVWFPDATLAPNKVASGVTSVGFPIRAIRVNISALAGTLRFTVLQGTQQP